MSETTEQITIPWKEIDPSSVATITQAREALNRATDTYWIPFELLQERPGFNPRVEYTGIMELAQKIEVNGLEPITIDMVKSDRKPKKGESEFDYYIDKGHRRFRALSKLHTGGSLQELDLPGIREGRVLCFINTKEVTELDRIRHALTSNDSWPLTALEQADCIWRLRNVFKLDNKAIREVTGLSRQHIDNMLTLAEQSDTVKGFIKQGVISATTVLKATRIAGTVERTSDLVSGLTKSKGTGKVRGTDVDQLQRQEAREAAADDPDEKFDENRPEIAQCQNVIRNVDKIGSLIKNVDSQLRDDVFRMIDFIQKDMVEIRLYVKKHKR
jgi:hypothetical protein